MKSRPLLRSILFHMDQAMHIMYYLKPKEETNMIFFDKHQRICCRRVCCPPLCWHPPVVGNGSGVGIISIAILILIALGVIF